MNPGRDRQKPTQTPQRTCSNPRRPDVSSFLRRFPSPHSLFGSEEGRLSHFSLRTPFELAFFLLVHQLLRYPTSRYPQPKLPVRP
jgi:hypothetical protein